MRQRPTQPGSGSIGILLAHVAKAEARQNPRAQTVLLGLGVTVPISQLCFSRLGLRQPLSLQWEDDCQQWLGYMLPSADSFIQLDSSDQSPRIESHWLSFGHMSITEMLQQGHSLKCSDWPSLGHQSIPATGGTIISSRVSWSENGGRGGSRRNGSATRRRKNGHWACNHRGSGTGHLLRQL